MKRIRILHTADLHLDSSFASLGVAGALGNQLRLAQKAVFARMIAHAQQWPADAVIIAGDFFDGPHVEEELLDYVLAALEGLAPIQVYIVSGNRDPYTPESPYALALWPDNVTLFPPGKWHAAPHETLPLTVHGFGCDGKEDSGAWFGALSVPDDDRLHIALAHGTEREHKPPEGKVFAPFNAADIAQERLAYVALGHFHPMTEVQGPFKTVMRYPGAPQGRSFTECGEKCFLEVEFTFEHPQEAVVTVVPVNAADVLFLDLAVDIGRADEVAAVFDAAVAGDRRGRVVRLRLEGSRPLLAADNAAALLEAAQSRFLHVEVEDGSVLNAAHRIQPRDATCLSKIVEAMQARMFDETDREAALREADALELAVKACYGMDLGAPDAMEEVL